MPWHGMTPHTSRSASLDLHYNEDWKEMVSTMDVFVLNCPPHPEMAHMVNTESVGVLKKGVSW